LQYLGIIFIDGMCGVEEKVMDAIGDKTNAIFIGGSAADDLRFRKTHVYANGRSFSDAAVHAPLKPAATFDLVQTQSVREMGPVLVVTKANEGKREIIEHMNQTASMIVFR